MKSAIQSLRVLHAELDACRACPKMIGPVVHGPAVASRVMLVGQAPGPREGSFGRPFAWTAGRTMFRWFEESLGVDEATFRARVYMAAVARCFPGKAKRRGRPPARRRGDRALQDVARARGRHPQARAGHRGRHARDRAGAGREGAAGRGRGQTRRARWHGREVDVVALPHPSGASPWHKIEPGKTLLRKALRRLGRASGDARDRAGGGHERARRQAREARRASIASSREPPRRSIGPSWPRCRCATAASARGPRRTRTRSAWRGSRSSARRTARRSW